MSSFEARLIQAQIEARQTKGKLAMKEVALDQASKVMDDALAALTLAMEEVSSDIRKELAVAREALSKWQARFGS